MFEAGLNYNDGEYKAYLTLTVYRDDDGSLALENLVKIDGLEGNYLDDNHEAVEELIWDNIDKNWHETFVYQLEM